jgi:hypothetical protein
MNQSTDWSEELTKSPLDLELSVHPSAILSDFPTLRLSIPDSQPFESNSGFTQDILYKLNLLQIKLSVHFITALTIDVGISAECPIVRRRMLAKFSDIYMDHEEQD